LYVENIYLYYNFVNKKDDNLFRIIIKFTYIVSTFWKWDRRRRNRCVWTFTIFL